MKRLLVAFLVIICAACSDGDKTSLTPTSPTVTPYGPVVMTLRIKKTGAELMTVSFGGLILNGLESQPASRTDTLATIIIKNYACGALEEKGAPVNNHQWELNADATILQGVRACGGNIKFEMLVETFENHERIYHTFKGVALLSADGTNLPITIADGPDGHKMLTGKLSAASLADEPVER